MRELTALRRETHAALCLACGKCSTMCPLAPSGWFSAARMVAIRDPETEIGAQTPALTACLTCASCEERCPEGVRFIDFVRGVRALAPPPDRRPCPHGEMLQAAARLMARAEPGSTPTPRGRPEWLTDDLEVAEEGELALFVGCLPLFDVLFERELGLATVDIARAAVRLLNRLDIRPVVVAEERCCGHDLLWGGERDTFEALAEANAAAFESRGVRHILTTCGECCRTWRLDYAEAVPDYRPRVEHLSEFLAARLEAGELERRPGVAPATTYQDPCRLGRHVGVYEAPRRVLEAFGDGVAADAGFREMERYGADAACCGTAGFLHCDAASRRLQSERLREAERTGAETLVTACPKCLIHFHCAQNEDRRRQREAAGIEVEDLTVLAAAMLDRAEPPAAGATEAEPATGVTQ